MTQFKASRNLAALCALLCFTGITQAQQDESFEAKVEEAVRAASAPSISCLVDTSGYDQFTPGTCIGFDFGGPRTTTAVFRVYNADPALHSFSWNVYGCSGYQCITSVTAYRTKKVDVTVTNNQTGQQWALHAEAVYENGY